MRKVLIISYNFPPVGGGGVQRAVKFIKYFSAFNWTADAVSALNPSVPLVDESLLRDLPSDCVIFRSKTLEPSYAMKSSMKGSVSGKKNIKSRLVSIAKRCVSNLLLPDAQVLWWPHTFFLISRLMKQRNHSVVFVSGPPFSTFVLVVLLSKIHGVPAVIDYRDEWSFSRDNWENAIKSPFAKLIDSWLENYVVSNASAITVASPYYERSIKERYPAATGKIHTITNGFDPTDFEGTDFLLETQKTDDSITILYTGTVWRATSFQAFLDGVRALVADSPISVKRLRLRIVGRIVQEEFSVIEQLKNLIKIEMVDYLPHNEIFKEMAAADLLLLTLSDLPGADKIIPGKTFEYLASPLPVLAIVPNGVTVDIIKNEKNVFISLPGDSETIKLILCDFLNNKHKKEIRTGIEKYSRPELTRKLVGLFNQVVK
ncbi:MAG: glycosyltransferase [Desulfuromonadaceae bacterium]